MRRRKPPSAKRNPRQRTLALADLPHEQAAEADATARLAARFVACDGDCHADAMWWLWKCGCPKRQAAMTGFRAGLIGWARARREQRNGIP